MTRQFKNIAKKIYKSGLFHSIQVKDKYIGYKNGAGVLFTFQVKRGQIGYFTAGHVFKWVERGLTYESEYTTMGNIERAKYSPFLIQQTDNPDYILRASKQITLNQI